MIIHKYCLNISFLYKNAKLVTTIERYLHSLGHKVRIEYFSSSWYHHYYQLHNLSSTISGQLRKRQLEPHIDLPTKWASYQNSWTNSSQVTPWCMELGIRGRAFLRHCLQHDVVYEARETPFGLGSSIHYDRSYWKTYMLVYTW